MDKKTARKTGLANRAAISAEARKEKDTAIQKQVIEKIRDLKTVGCYVSFNDEADTSLIRQYCYETGKVLAVPKVDGNTLVFHRILSDSDLEKGCFGVMEPVLDDPVDPSKIDFMIVPLSSFDVKGNRTGYGKGYYDRILGRCRHTAGIAYAEQKTDLIEADPWDIALDEIIYA